MRQSRKLENKMKRIMSLPRTNHVTQYYLGVEKRDETFACACTSDIDLNVKDSAINKSGSKNIQVRGEGANSGRYGEENDKHVLNIMKQWGLNKLASIDRVTNPPGRCAEPHAVADALWVLDDYNINAKDIDNIKKIRVSDAVKKDKTKDRCQTCQQWILGNEVKPDYLQLG